MSKTTIKLAEALLLRKQFQAKVDQLKQVQVSNLFEMKFVRKKITEDMDDVQAQVPLLTAQQVTHEYDWYAKQLRLVDAAIQQANWATDISVDGAAVGEYTPLPKPEPRGPKA